MSILQKLYRIQQKAVSPKDKDNSFAGFKYRNVEGILRNCKPIFKQEQVYCKLSDEVVRSTEAHTSRRRQSCMIANQARTFQRQDGQERQRARKGTTLLNAPGAQAPTHGSMPFADCLGWMTARPRLSMTLIL